MRPYNVLGFPDREGPCCDVPLATVWMLEARWKMARFVEHTVTLRILDC